MLLRMRRASIALLALVSAVGLGLILFIAQIGWPEALSGPLPGAPTTRAGAIHGAVALDRSGSPAGRPLTVGAGGPAQSAPPRGSRSADDSQLGHAKKLANAPGKEKGAGGAQPLPSQPATEPAPVAAAPPPAPVAVEGPPQPNSGGSVTASVDPKASEAAVGKAVSDGGKSAAATATKSQGEKSANDKSTSSASSKSGDAASTKAHRDESAAKAKAKAKVPPPVAAPEKSAPAPPSPAAAKEAADAAKAN
jgi:hypothetical protein